MEEQNRVEAAPLSRTFEEAIDLSISLWLGWIFGESKQDNGDVMCNIFARWASDKVKQKNTPELIAKQKKVFAESIKKQLIVKEHNGRRWGTTLDVDYHPNEILEKAIKEAGISELVLPIKTLTRINDLNQVEGRNGYRSDWFTI